MCNSAESFEDCMVANAKTLKKGFVYDSDGVCEKCSNEGETYKLSYRQAECRDCFLMYTRHKFRATLGSSKILPRNAKILLVFDGSAEADVLLDMVYHAITLKSFKRLQCDSCAVLYIDDTVLLRPYSTKQEYKDKILALRELLSHYEKVESFIMPIGNGRDQTKIFNLKNLESYLERDKSLELQHVNKILSLHSKTAQQDYMKYCRIEIIGAAAVDLNCAAVFLPDTSTTIATNLLSAIALGRGGSAALDVGLSDNRLGANVQILRPIKDLTAEEVQLYVATQQLRILSNKHFDKLDSSTLSLQDLTQMFIDDLQQNYSSTMSTVSRTGNKIASSAAVKPICAFCHSSFKCEDSPTLLAIEFSSLISEVGKTVHPHCNDLDAVARRNLQDQQGEEISRLCHACRNIKNETDQKNLL